MSTVTSEWDDTATVSGLPAPAGWVCLERKSDADQVFFRTWKRTTGEAITVIESIYKRDDGHTWLHVSVSKPNRKIPTWDDVQVMRKTFIGEHRESYMIFPTKERYVTIHPGVLHLYCAIDTPDGVLPHMEGEVNGLGTSI